MRTIKTLCVVTQIAAMFSATAAEAAGYMCERQAVASTFTSNGRPRGNWTTQNTSNWHYVAATGNDVYQHNTLSNTIQTLCQRAGPSPIGWNLGTRNNDYNGLEDACGTWSQAVSYSLTIPSCSNGFSLSANKQTCTRPAIASHFVANRIPSGNWTYQNTSNFSYVDVAASSGDDFYRRNSAPHTVVSTLCKRNGPGGWDYGVRYPDYNGLKDMCGTWTAAQTAQTVAASCPSGHTLVYKP